MAIILDGSETYVVLLLVTGCWFVVTYRLGAIVREASPRTSNQQQFSARDAVIEWNVRHHSMKEGYSGDFSLPLVLQLDWVFCMVSSSRLSGVTALSPSGTGVQFHSERLAFALRRFVLPRATG